MTTDRNGPRCEAWTGCRMDPGHDGPHYPQTGWHETRPYVVCDSKDVPVGGQTPVLGKFRTEQEAAEFIDTLPAAATGRYSLDGPAEDGEQYAEPTYTRDQIDAAVNAGANMIGYSNLINLIVNAQLTLLDQPDATLEDVILANWQAESEDYEAAGITDPARDLTEAEERAADAALVTRIEGWTA